MNNKSQLTDDNEEIIYAFSEPLKVGYSWIIKGMAWGGFTFSSWLFFMLVREEGFSQFFPIGLVPVLFWFASIAGIYKFSQYIIADNHSIAVVGWFGKREIKWEEIERIKVRKHLADMAISGANKKIIITLPTNWRGQDVRELWDYLNTQVEERDIEVLG